MMHFKARSRLIFHVLDELAAQQGGTLTPELIVKETEDKDHPLHEEFVWENSRAGHLYRIGQARRLLVVYKVQKINPQGKKEEVRQFYRISLEPGDPKQYVSSKKIFADHEFTKRAAIEVLAQFQRSMKMLEPFPQYFGPLLEACNRELALISFRDKETPEAM